MRIKRTIKYPGDEPSVVVSNFPTHYLDRDDPVRKGFEDGTHTKIIVENKNMPTIIYEKI